MPTRHQQTVNNKKHIKEHTQQPKQATATQNETSTTIKYKYKHKNNTNNKSNNAKQHIQATIKQATQDNNSNIK